MEDNGGTVKEIMEKNVGGMVGSLIVAFILGTMAMVYSSDKSSQVLETKMQYMVTLIGDLKDVIAGLRIQVDVNTRDRWTRIDHNEYSRGLDARLGKVEDRLLKLEIKTLEKNNL